MKKLIREIVRRTCGRDSVVSLSERGLNGMRWIDSNYDGKLTALDPVWNELQVWQAKSANDNEWRMAA